MPTLRPFRALRYAVPDGDLTRLLCPPYDVISPAERVGLLARHPHNAVRLELPADLGEADAESYRSAARTAAEWRTDRVLVKDRQPSITVHRMSWPEPSGGERSCTGVFVRLRLEAFGPGAGIRPHERTMSGPKEDRLQLLRATGLNTSPIVLLADVPVGDGGPGAALLRLTERSADARATTEGGVRHELWVHEVVAEGGGAPIGGPDAATLITALAVGPLTIADGHHRYETALAYRDDRGRNRACESDPAWDYVLALIYPVDLAPRVLPTHRVVIDGPTGDDLVAALEPFFEVEPLTDAGALVARLDARSTPAPERPGSGRLGLLSDGRAVELRVRETAIADLIPPELSVASRGLDVNILAGALARTMGVDAATLAAGGRLVYEKGAREAVDLVRSGRASSCFLLDPMPAWAVTRVAAAGELMPQKSTYFDPKAPSGLLFGPLEW